MLLGLLLMACTGGDIQKPDPSDSGGTLGAFEVAGLDPAEGSSAGGTDLRLSGLGFTVETEVAIDGAACTGVALLSPELLACMTPAGALGAAEVRLIREDGQTATAEYTYIDGGTTGGDGGDTDTDSGTIGDTDTGADDTGTTGGTDGGGTDGGTTDSGSTDGGTDGGTDDTGRVVETVDYCHLQWPCEQTVAAGEVSDTVYCWVYEPGVTDAVGSAAGIVVEVGVGADGSNPVSGWTWDSAAWLEDVYYEKSPSNDLYAGEFTAPSAAGDYDYACRASADGGSSWTVCDSGDDGALDGCGDGLGGSLDGYAAPDAGQLTVE